MANNGITISPRKRYKDIQQQKILEYHGKFKIGQRVKYTNKNRAFIEQIAIPDFTGIIIVIREFSATVEIEQGQMNKYLFNKLNGKYNASYKLLEIIEE